MRNNIEKRDVAIKITGVKKRYRLGQIGGGTLQADIQSWWARVRGKEDPNVKIGENQRLVGQTFMALNGVDLTVYKGEALGIIGRNGAGKSTLLKLLSRVTAPTEGKIQIWGRVASMLEVGTGFNGEMTGRENVYLNGAILGMTKAEIDAKMEDIIEFSEVREFIDTPVKRYSSGMYVKLAFSVAAHLDSEIMIMDEVLAVGDMAFQKKCLERMKRAAKEEGRTVLYVSHNMNTITQLCDRCVVLDKGKKIFEGDVDKAIQVYMADTVKNMGVDIDISKSRMAHLSKVPRGKMTRLTLLGKADPIYEYGEHIPFRLDIHSNEDMEALSLRVELRTMNSIPVGLTMIKDFSGISKGKDASFEFDMDLEGLVTGGYIVCLVLYEVNEYGGFIDVDAVYPAFSFDIIDTDNHMKINWVHSNWGNIKFKDIKRIK